MIDVEDWFSEPPPEPGPGDLAELRAEAEACDPRGSSMRFALLNGDERSPLLVETSSGEHPAACGERVPCPLVGDHKLGLYNPAERQVRRLAVVVVCHACQRAWREVTA